MYNIGDNVLIINNNKQVFVKIIKINLDNTLIVALENGIELRIYKEDIII